MFRFLNYFFRYFRSQRSPDRDCEMAEKDANKPVKAEPNDSNGEEDDLIRRTAAIRVGDCIANRTPRAPIPPEALW